MFTVKGKVSSLEISDGSFDPQQGFQRRLYGDATPAEPFSVTTPYDKRIAVQHFGCHIGDRVVVGTFPNVGFKNGDAVKAVVTNLDGEGVFAHALMTTADGRLWLPHSVCKGTRAALVDLAKKAALMALAAWVCVLLLMLQSPPKAGVFVAGALAGLLILACGALAVFFINRANPEGPYTDKVLTMLGFKNPKVVNLSPYSEHALRVNSFDQIGSPHVFDLWAALAAYGSVKLRRAAAR